MQRCQFCLIIKEYISRWVHTSNKALTLSWRRSLSYRNKSIDLLCQLMDWFLNDKGTHHEWVKRLFTHHTPKSFLIYRKAELPFFFLLGLFFTNIMIHRAAGEGVDYFFNSSLPLPLTLQTLRNYASYCWRELTAAHSWQPDSNQKHLVSYQKSLSSKLRAP